MIFRIPEEVLIFPDPDLAEEDGLLGIGGDLSTERLLLAYSQGVFPWFNAGDPICWYTPAERCVIFPDRVKISKSMRKIVKDGIFRISRNEAFREVIVRCAESPRKDQEGTWITNEMQAAYLSLHQSGYAHSVEVWQGNELVGGLYGLEMNGVFCGESMFSLRSNASKAALIWLCSNPAYRLIDCQVPNDHLMRMGAEMISRKAYRDILQQQAE